ncbi:MAG: nitroreductase family protein [Oligoflexia bacterium]|nr:nitroreductase family protein [Oligoflexia bacterium]
MSSILTSDVNIPTRENRIATDSSSFDTVCQNRRSVRKYEPNVAIPEQVMQKCFENALLAPNSSNLQPWEIYWVKSKEKKEALIKYCFSQNAAATASELVVFVARIDKIKKHRKLMVEVIRKKTNNNPPKILLDYYQKLVPIAYSKGWFSILAPFKWLAFTSAGFFRPSPREPLGKSDLQLWAAKSTALACENFMLSLSAYGYDSCPMEGLDSVRVKKLLKLPRSSVIVMAISAGKRLPEGVYGDRIRFDASEVLFTV